MHYVAHVWLSGVVLTELAGTQIETEILCEYESESYVRISTNNRRTLEHVIRLYQERGNIRNTDSSIQIIVAQCYASLEGTHNYLALGQAAARHGLVPMFTYGDKYQARLYATNSIALERCIASIDCEESRVTDLCPQVWYKATFVDTKANYLDPDLQKMWMNSFLTSVIRELNNRSGGCVELTSDSVVLLWKGQTAYVLVPSPSNMMDVALAVLEKNKSWAVYVDNHTAAYSPTRAAADACWTFETISYVE